MLERRRADILRGAFTLGALALALLTLAACASPEERARRAAAAEENARITVANMEQAVALAEKHCFPFHDRGDLFAEIETLKARAAAENLPEPTPYGQFEPVADTANEFGWRIPWALVGEDLDRSVGLFLSARMYAPESERDMTTGKREVISQNPVPDFVTCEVKFRVARPLGGGGDKAFETRGAKMASDLLTRQMAHMGGTPSTSVLGSLDKLVGLDEGLQAFDKGGTTYRAFRPNFRAEHIYTGTVTIRRPAPTEASFRLIAD